MGQLPVQTSPGSHDLVVSDTTSTSLSRSARKRLKKKQNKKKRRLQEREHSTLAESDDHSELDDSSAQSRLVRGGTPSVEMCRETERSLDPTWRRSKVLTWLDKFLCSSQRGIESTPGVFQTGRKLLVVNNWFSLQCQSRVVRFQLRLRTQDVGRLSSVHQFRPRQI